MTDALGVLDRWDTARTNLAAALDAAEAIADRMPPVPPCTGQEG